MDKVKILFKCKMGKHKTTWIIESSDAFLYNPIINITL